MRYENGSPLTRGEFVAHMQRVDRTLSSIDERLGHIEEKMERPRRLLLGALGSTAGRLVLLVVGLVITIAATHFTLEGYVFW